MRGLLTAIGFLTVMPVPASAQSGSFGRSAAWFPVVGALIGLALAGVDWCGRALWDPYVAAALMIGVGIAFTGGLHIDGLMDTADALFSRRSRERMLEIMRDPRSGALGIAAGISVLALKFAAYAHLAGGEHWRVVVAAPVVGRLAVVIALAVFPYAREAGTGASFAAQTRWGHAIAALLLAAAISYGVLGWHGLVLVGGGLVVALLGGLYVTGRLGGLTGDVYGAINELAEIVALLGGAALISRQ
jgi:adenosylcobinamide-GDP ribazoletransferase